MQCPGSLLANRSGASSVVWVFSSCWSSGFFFRVFLLVLPLVVLISSSCSCSSSSFVRLFVVVRLRWSSVVGFSGRKGISSRRTLGSFFSFFFLFSFFSDLLLVLVLLPTLSVRSFSFVVGGTVSPSRGAWGSLLAKERDHLRLRARCAVHQGSQIRICAHWLNASVRDIRDS
jgi:hypothetical protein